MGKLKFSLWIDKLQITRIRAPLGHHTASAICHLCAEQLVAHGRSASGTERALLYGVLEHYMIHATRFREVIRG